MEKMERKEQRKVFVRPYIVVEKIFERVGLACDKKGGQLTLCTGCNSAGTSSS
jgi:hypothetical protein